MSKKLSSEDEKWETDEIEDSVNRGETAYCYNWQMMTTSIWRQWSGSNINKVNGK